MIKDADEIRSTLRMRFAEAVERGDNYIEINSGELGRALEIYPSPNRMPNLCRVMRDEMGARDAITSDTREGYDGPRLSIRYSLPR